jgi:hypothetical protein
MAARKPIRNTISLRVFFFKKTPIARSTDNNRMDMVTLKEYTSKEMNEKMGARK